MYIFVHFSKPNFGKIVTHAFNTQICSLSKFDFPVRKQHRKFYFKITNVFMWVYVSLNCTKIYHSIVMNIHSFIRVKIWYHWKSVISVKENIRYSLQISSYRKNNVFIHSVTKKSTQLGNIVDSGERWLWFLLKCNELRHISVKWAN